jgi:hypothetical protein
MRKKGEVKLTIEEYQIFVKRDFYWQITKKLIKIQVIGEMLRRNRETKIILQKLCLCECRTNPDPFDFHWHNIGKCAEQCDCDDCPCPDLNFDPNDYDSTIEGYQYTNN